LVRYSTLFRYRLYKGKYGKSDTIALLRGWVKMGQKSVT